MSAPDPASGYGYIAYIDESGDFGLRNVAPIDRRGASEWLVLSAVVIRAEVEPKIVEGLRLLRIAAKNTQSSDLHFRNLTDRQKRVVCAGLAAMDVRLFVIISNKRNMRRHKNELAAFVSNTRSWFYWWMCRLLLERVTEFCERRNERTKTPNVKVRLELSRRNYLRYQELSGYLTRLWLKDQAGELIVYKRVPKWPLLDFNQIFAFDHGSRAGLQLADVVASSFFQAVNREATVTANSEFAEALRERVWSKGPRENPRWLDEGFTLFPHTLSALNLDESQKRVFRFYGYPAWKW
jgi:hypothetical protein